MRAAIIITIAFLVVIIALTFVGYYGYNHHWFDNYLNKDKQQPVAENYTNYSFLIIDYETQQRVSVDFKLFKLEYIWNCLKGEQLKLYLENKDEFESTHGPVSERDGEKCYVADTKYVEYKEGKFLSSFNTMEIKANQKYALFVYSNDYYTGQLIFYVDNIDNQKTIFEVWHKPELNLSLSRSVTFASNSLYNENLSLDIKHQLRDIVICTDWAFGIIYAKPQFYREEITVPDRLRRVDKCYSLGVTADNRNIEIPFIIKTGDLTLADYFTVYVIDKDRYWNRNTWVDGVENDKKEDLGAKDYSKNFTLSFAIK